MMPGVPTDPAVEVFPVGLVQITGVVSRWAVAAGGIVLVLLGCLQKLAFEGDGV